MKNSLKGIKEIYENNLLSFGKNYKGVGWKKKKDAITRHRIMSKIILNKKSRNHILDLGCGLSHFYNYLKINDFKFKYFGVDLSQEMIRISKKKYPKNKYYCLDILKDHNKISKVDYIVINGLFTQKGKYTNEKMFKFLKKILKISYAKANKGIAFNVMSELVEWKNKGNFYLSIEKITKFINQYLSNSFIINHQYGLYEYTIFIYKKIR